jgi:hypothetical protein
MILLAIVNMLVLLVGFLAGLRKTSPGANHEMAGNSAASQACIEQTR